MILSLIAAVSDNNAIGRKNALPWFLPADLRYFKQTTIGKPVLMGRKTYDSLGKPLPGRLNMVLSRQPRLDLPVQVLLYSNIDDAIERLKQENVEEAFIIGGGKLFEETLSIADRMYITHVHTVVPDADAFFPEIDHSHWKLVWEEKHGQDNKNEIAFDFQKFERIDL